MIVAGTGHRPDGILEPWGVVTLKARVKLQHKATRFICGMAEGFDLLSAAAAMELDLPITAARPWTYHKVGKDWHYFYDQVLDYADEIVVVTESDTYPGYKCMHERDKWMVDHADAVMAYMQPDKTSGGTYYTVQYAKKKGVPVANIIADPPF